MTAPTEQDHADAILAALTAAGAVPYLLGKVPATPPDYYTEVTVERRFIEEPRATVGDPRRGWRFTTRAVARKETNARVLRAKADAIENQRLTVAGQLTTKVRFETSETIGDDNDWWTGLTTWTYLL